MRTIYFIGDSLSYDYNIEQYPQVGYASILRLYKADDVFFINLAKHGCSTKSFLSQGRFKLVEDSIKEGDLLLVEFGNNDEKESDSLRYTNKDKDFLDNLNYFYNTAVNKKANCIFINSPTRRNFLNGRIVDNHNGYPQSMVEFCKKNNYICIDLNSLTIDLYNRLGEEETKKFHLIYDSGIYERYIDGVYDNSHYNMCGAKVISSIILVELEKNFIDYYKYFIKYKESSF